MSIKVEYNEEVRKVALSNEITWTLFEDVVKSLFEIPSENEIVGKYLDEDGDLITVSTDHELHELVSQKNIRLRIVVLNSVKASPSPAPTPRFERTASNFSTTSSSDSTSTPSSSTSTSSSSSSSSSSSKAEEKQKAPEQSNENENSNGNETKDENTNTFESLIEQFASLAEHVENVFNQHPEIQQTASNIFTQFTELISKEVEEERKKEEERRSQYQQQYQQQQQRGGFPFGQWGPTYGHCRRGFFGHHFQAIVQEKLRELQEMGYIDENLNRHLLRKHRGNLSAVVAELNDLYSSFE